MSRILIFLLKIISWLVRLALWLWRRRKPNQHISPSPSQRHDATQAERRL